MGYQLKDRVVFITGASGGIGRACAVEYHRAGCRVVATARSYDKLVELSRELGEDRVFPIQLDVTDAAQREAALHKAREHFGGIDVLLNNAAWASVATVESGQNTIKSLKTVINLPLWMLPEWLAQLFPIRRPRMVAPVLGDPDPQGADRIERMTHQPEYFPRLGHRVEQFRHQERQAGGSLPPRTGFGHLDRHRRPVVVTGQILERRFRAIAVARQAREQLAEDRGPAPAATQHDGVGSFIVGSCHRRRPGPLPT